jgi:MFS family permease
MRNLKTFSSLRNPVYRLYYGGMLGQMAAMNMQLVTQSLLIYRLTGSTTILGTLALSHAVPLTVLSLFGGVLADRLEKKYILLTGQSISAVVALAVAFSLSLGYLSAERAGSWWILIVAAALQGTVMGLMMPSRQAIIAEIVSSEQLMNAVALNTLGMNLLRFLAPAIAGLLIDTYSFEAVYYAMTGMYLMAVFFISFLPRTGTVNVRGQSVFMDLKDSLRYVWNDRTIFLILGFTLLLVVLSRPYQFLLPVFTEDILKVDATGLGVLMSVSGVGAMIGSVFLASLPNKRRGIMLAFSGLILGLMLVSFSFSESWYLSLILIGFVGLGDTGRVTLANTLVQYYVANDYRGRVMSLLMMEFGIMSFGVFFAGIIAESIGVQWSVGGMAMVLTLISVLALLFARRLRKLD